MKRVLCFGDSNTWGYVPAKGERYPEEIRWPGVAQRQLGSEFCLIEEALSGRTTVWEDPVRPYMNALEYLGPCLLSQFPLDAIIIMLGTNDLKQRFHLNAWAVAEGIRQLIKETKQCDAEFNDRKAEILVISPILISESIKVSPYADEFEGDRTVKLSGELGREIERIALDEGCGYMDASLHACASDEDGLHMLPEGHNALGLAIAERIRSL